VCVRAGEGVKEVGREGGRDWEMEPEGGEGTRLWVRGLSSTDASKPPTHDFQRYFGVYIDCCTASN
jgi:hypothetical protein